MSVGYGRYGTMLCCWFAMGLIKEELVEEGREDMADHRGRERQSIARQTSLFFFFLIINFMCSLYRLLICLN